MSFWGPLVGAGISAIGGLFGDDDKGTTQERQWERLPDYKEATGARKSWWNMLQQWGKDPYYGALSPDWGDIWSRTQNKVRRHFWGGPEGGGAIQKVRASAARRGVSDSPALDVMTSRMGMKEGQLISDLATEQALQEAQFGERARNTWLNSIMGLANLKPQYGLGGITTTPPSGGGLSDMISGIGGAVGEAIGSKEMMDWYSGMMSDVFGGNDDNYGSSFLTQQYTQGSPWLGGLGANFG